MIEIGQNLKNVVAFSMLMSAMVTVIYIVLKFVTKISFKINPCTKKALRKERLGKRWNWIEEHPGAIISSFWLAMAILIVIYATIL